MRVVEALLVIALVGCTGQDYELGQIEEASNSGSGGGSGGATDDGSTVSMTGVDSGSDSGSESGGETDGVPLVDPFDPVGPVKVFGDTGITMASGGVYTEAFSGILLADSAADAVLRLNLTGVVTVHQPSGGSRGLGYDADGVLLVAESETGRLVRVDGEQVEEVASGLGAPTSVVVAQSGHRYVTDTGSGVFRIDPDGTVHHDVPDLPGAAGAALHPDDEILFVTRLGRREIHAYPRNADGSLGSRVTFAEASAPVAGVCVDEFANVLAAGDAGVEAFRPDGERWSTLQTPAPLVDCSFGSAGALGVLYMVAATAVYVVELPVTGDP